MIISDWTPEEKMSHLCKASLYTSKSTSMDPRIRLRTHSFYVSLLELRNDLFGLNLGLLYTIHNMMIQYSELVELAYSRLISAYILCYSRKLVCLINA